MCKIVPGKLSKNSAEYDDESDIFIVSHGGTVRTILCAIMNLDLNEMWKISIDNAGISCILQLEKLAG